MSNFNIIESLKQKVTVPNSVILQFIGQSGMIVQGKNETIVIDPYLSNYAEEHYGLVRNYQPFYKPIDLKGVDYYFITHDHADHLDSKTVQICANHSPNTIFIAPAYCYQLLLENGVKMSNIKLVNDDKWMELGEVQFRAIPSAHEEFETSIETGHRFVGYICTLNGVTLYHAGDTIVYRGLSNYLNEQTIDIAMLPINGRDYFRFNRGAIGNMNYKEAAELAYHSNFDLTIPVHFDMFSDNTERPGNFIDYIQEKYPKQKVHVMAREEKMFYTNNI